MHTFRRCVSRYQGERYVKQFRCFDQYLVMAWRSSSLTPPSNSGSSSFTALPGRFSSSHSAATAPYSSVGICREATASSSCFGESTSSNKGHTSIASVSSSSGRSMQQRLYFRPEPHGHGSFRPGTGCGSRRKPLPGIGRATACPRSPSPVRCLHHLPSIRSTCAAFRS